ncbi:MAG TPA: hypothetical protein VNX02_09215 [Steroidobacteraceae bacterium]|jgi:hypothetical protein|nr:hypothetical protein [Steroidobacteraceae bacterium]
MLLLIGSAAALSQAAASGEVLSSADLCVTEGHVVAAAHGNLAVDAPKMRAYTKRLAADAAELRFTYLGPTGTQQALGSGRMREQLGLKLHAADPCNLIYVMWRIQPSAELVVSVKSNPGLHSSSECTNHGYQNIEPRMRGALPRLKPGDTHRLSAEMRGRRLTVLVDGMQAWQGEPDDSAAQLRGPAGVRSDNVHFEFELASSPGQDRQVCDNRSQGTD